MLAKQIEIDAAPAAVVSKENRIENGPFEVDLPEIGRASVVFDISCTGNHLYTFCAINVIKAKKGKLFAVGIAVKNPGDKIDFHKGRLVSFGRALGEFYSHVTRKDIFEGNSFYSIRDHSIACRRMVWKQILDLGV